MATSSLEWGSRSSPIQHRSTTPPGYPVSNSSPAPDTSSPVYPDRHIRPLPKRKIRDRLSAQQTEDIVFPSVPSKEAPLFSFPYPEPTRQSSNAENGNEADDGRGQESRSVRRDTGIAAGRPERDGMKISPRQGSLRSRPQGRSNVGKTAPLPIHVLLVDSANSSVDGEEGFENTNNKKKRKIPQPQHSTSNIGTSSLTNVSTDMANLGISSREPDAVAGAAQPIDSIPSQNGQITSNSTLDPANPKAQGRFTSSRSGRGSLDRRPLATSTNAVNLSGSARSRLSPSSKAAGIQNLPVDAGPGIISSAIANAQHQNIPLPSNKANENTSLLEKATKGPQTGNFTFSCDPPTTNLVWPGESNMSQPPTTQAYPTPPSQYPNSAHRPGASATNSASQTPQLHQDQQGQQAPQKKTRRRPGRIYDMAARKRRLQQEYANHLHPPRREDLWICEFCEYEAIYGQPPRALIHLYEVKDRKEQQRQAERRRLLDKAKIKGRKGKKAAASAAKQASKSLAHQAAEFQKNEMLRATAKLETHKQQLQQAHRELQAHNAATEAAQANEQHYSQQQHGGPHEQMYDDDDDDDEEYDEEGVYDDDEDEGDGDTEEMVTVDARYLTQEPPPPPPPPDAHPKHYKVMDRRE